MEITDETCTPPQHELAYVYASFWERVGATIIDCLVTIPFTILSEFNIKTWKSTALLLVIGLISMTYKSFMEYNYKATFGKMALGIVVLNDEDERADLGQILLRNSVGLALILFTLTLSFLFLNDASFSHRTLKEFYEAKGLTYYVGIAVMAVGFFGIADLIYFFQDPQYQTLRDKIAGTFVVKKQRQFVLSSDQSL